MSTWTVPESSVFHSRPDCPALTRRNRYYPASSREDIENMSGPKVAERVYRGRRPCRLCRAAGGGEQ